MVTVSNNFLSGLTEVFQKYWNMYFKAGSFLRNLSIVMSGTVLAQVIGFAAMPIISRLFTVEDFGIFGTFQSVFAPISAGITLQYNQAIVLSKENNDAINVFFVSVISSIFVSFFLIIVAIIFHNYLLEFINFPNLLYIFFVVLASFVFGINQAFQSWCIREKEFKNTSLSQVIRTLFSTISWLVAGYFKFGAIGLILGSILSNFVASINLARVFFSNFINFKHNINWSRVVGLAKEYRDFPLYAAPQNVMNALSQGLPVLLMGHFFGFEVVGFYAFGVKILQTPINFVLNPLRQVLYQKAAEEYNKCGNFLQIYIRTTVSLLVLAFIPCLVLFIWAPQIFSIIFGQAWFESGVYARWLILWLFVSFSNVPSVIFVKILRKQKELFLYEFIILLARLLVLIFSGMYLSPLLTVIIFSMLGFVSNMILIICVFFVVYKNSKNLMRCRNPRLWAWS